MKKILIVGMLSILPLAAHAERPARDDGTIPSIYKECGLGGMVFHKSTTSSNVGAIISNVLWDYGLTASTSAFSSPNVCTNKKKEVAKLILETLPDLEKDIAAGEGKYLTALATTAGCKNGVLNGHIRTGYAGVVSKDNYSTMSKTDKAEQMFNIVDQAISTEAAACTI